MIVNLNVFNAPKEQNVPCSLYLLRSNGSDFSFPDASKQKENSVQREMLPNKTKEGVQSFDSIEGKSVTQGDGAHRNISAQSDCVSYSQKKPPEPALFMSNITVLSEDWFRMSCTGFAISFPVAGSKTRVSEPLPFCSRAC